MNILLLGAPGSGKGSHAKLLCDRFAMTHISTGDIFRAEIKKASELGQSVEAIVKSGQLVPDEIVVPIVANTISSGDGLILDGFPRTLKQAQIFEDFRLPIHRIIYLDVFLNTILTRLAKRGRPDDEKDIVIDRFNIYQQQTKPVIDFYSNFPNFVRVDANHELNAVQAVIEGHL